MPDLTPVFLEPERPDGRATLAEIERFWDHCRLVAPLHILDDTCWCRGMPDAGQYVGDCCCEYCLDYSLEDEE